VNVRAITATMAMIPIVRMVTSIHDALILFFILCSPFFFFHTAALPYWEALYLKFNCFFSGLSSVKNYGDEEREIYRL
jgi:hypothetical protein